MKDSAEATYTPFKSLSCHRNRRSASLGETRVNAIISGQKSRMLEYVMLDTDATDTMIPVTMAEDLLVEVETRNIEADTMKGVTLVDRGNALVEIGGRKRRVPILIVREKLEPLIGLTTLEAPGFKVNPIARQLELEDRSSCDHGSLQQ